MKCLFYYEVFRCFLPLVFSRSQVGLTGCVFSQAPCVSAFKIVKHSTKCFIIITMHFLPREKLLSYLSNETQKRNVCLSSYRKRSPACLAYYVSTETERIRNRLGVKSWKFQRTTNLLDLPITSRGC